MLQPREADIPALLLFFVVLPLVTYFLLGKCNEASKKNARVSVLAQLAAVEALTAEAMATTDAVPVAPLSNVRVHACARCFGPATTRCSRCKSVRYCSGKCQIIHWRQGHKQECQQWSNANLITPFSPSLVTETDHCMASSDVQEKSTFNKNDGKESHNIDALYATNSPANLSHGYTLDTKTRCKQDSHKIRKEISRHEEGAPCCLEEASICDFTSSLHASVEFAELPLDDPQKRYKLGNDTYLVSSSMCITQKNASQPTGIASTKSRNIKCEAQNLRVQDRNTLESSDPGETTSSFIPERNMIGRGKTEPGDRPIKVRQSSLEFSSTGENTLNSSSENPSAKGGMKFRRPPYTVDSSLVSHRPPAKPSRGSLLTRIERKASMERESLSIGATFVQDANEISKTREKKMAGAKPPQKPPKHGTATNTIDSFRKNKVLFPYEDLVKLFQWEISDVYPRGLLNCGNSCYANAVLQCLTSTKPLLVYLLRGTHSRSCHVRDWCLICELELHVSTLLEAGGPLSPSKVLSNMRNIGCRIGGGNQEDAHEFLRLLVMSMQSICLEGLGGEKEVDPRVQETTLIQQIFGGQLKSKVRCLRCESESERYENIMDLTLEIHGRVESLQDALTQFTSPEDLDGDNMYRCGRCCAYVKARKQLNVHEAPNILTIVLKRFQTGKYGKINKCVTFPDMLDMNPFMTGASDRPPLYLLYAVVVHLDTLNASFSGHYVSYVKDMQENWFRIDDTEVQAVSLDQVMSEGAYILFYTRAFPRPPGIYLSKAMSTEMADETNNSKPSKSSWHGSAEANVGGEGREDIGGGESRYFIVGVGRDAVPKEGICVRADAYDAYSSDWSVFTSSDESSFTTESTSDSFSTVDHTDGGGMDPIASLFNPGRPPESSHKGSSIAGRDRPKTRFFSESRRFVLDRSASAHCARKGKDPAETILGRKCCMNASTGERERSQWEM